MASILILLIGALLLTWGIAHTSRQVERRFQFRLGLAAIISGIGIHILYLVTARGGDIPLLLVAILTIGSFFGSCWVGDTFGRRTNWLRWLFGTGGHRYRQPLYPITRLPPDHSGGER